MWERAVWFPLCAIAVALWSECLIPASADIYVDYWANSTSFAPLSAKHTLVLPNISSVTFITDAYASLRAYGTIVDPVSEYLNFSIQTVSLVGRDRTCSHAHTPLHGLFYSPAVLFP